MCTNWLPTASTLCPLLSLFLQKSSGSKSQLHSKQSSNGPSPDNFMTIGGCFECYTYCNTALGWLKKKKEKNVNNSDFRPFQVCHFKVVPIHIAITTAGWGKLYKWLYVFLNMSINLFPGNDIEYIDWSRHLVSGHPYIWLCYCEPIFIMFKVAFVPLAHVCMTGVTWQPLSL